MECAFEAASNFESPFDSTADRDSVSEDDLLDLDLLDSDLEEATDFDAESNPDSSSWSFVPSIADATSECAADSFRETLLADEPEVLWMEPEKSTRADPTGGIQPKVVFDSCDPVEWTDEEEELISCLGCFSFRANLASLSLVE